MADGGKNGNLSSYSKDNGACGDCGDLEELPLDPFAGKFLEPYKGKGGPCLPDMSWRTLETLLDLRRYGTFFINLTRTAGGDLVVAATGNNPLTVFSAGYNENGNATGLLPTNQNLTRAETDGYKQGALAPDSTFSFRTVGASVVLGHPFRATTIGTDTSGRALDPFWQGSGYVESLYRLLIQCSHLTVKHGNAAAGYELGLLNFYPSMSAPLGGERGLTFGQPMAGAFVPFRVPDFGGGPDDDQQLTAQLTVDHSFQVTQDPATPVPALAGGEAYLLPVTMELIGHVIRNGTLVDKSSVRNEAAMVMADALEGLDLTNPADAAVANRIMQKLRAVRGR